MILFKNVKHNYALCIGYEMLFNIMGCSYRKSENRKIESSIRLNESVLIK